jgi:hypothetical protein
MTTPAAPNGPHRDGTAVVAYAGDGTHDSPRVITSKHRIVELADPQQDNAGSAEWVSGSVTVSTLGNGVTVTIEPGLSFTIHDNAGASTLAVLLLSAVAKNEEPERH